MSLKATIMADMKAAMRAGDKQRLVTIRMLLAAIKQIEVDERKVLDDTAVLAIIDKLVKQRRDAAKQFRDADRPELAEKEDAEIVILQHWLPAQLTDDEITALIAEAIRNTGAQSMADMGKVMGQLKPQLQGRADMGAVSGKIKAQLG